MPTIDWETCAPGDIATLSCIPDIFEVIVFWALVFAGIVALFLIIFAGYKFLNSGGDPKSVEGARKTLTYGLLGFVLILLSFLIINIIATVTGVDCIKNFSFGNCGGGTVTYTNPGTIKNCPNPSWCQFRPCNGNENIVPNTQCHNNAPANCCRPK